MQVGGRHWAVALSGAVLVHAGIAAAILWQPPQSGAASAGMGGIEVSLGPAGGAPGGEAQPVKPVAEAETVEPSETAATAALTKEAAVDQPETVPPDPVEAVQIATAAPSQTLIEPVPAEVAPPVEVAETRPVENAAADVETPPVQERQAEAPEAPIEVAASQEAASQEVVAEDVVAPPLPKRRPDPPKRPQREPGSEWNPEPRQQTTEASEEQLAKVDPSAAGAGGKAGTQASPEAGSAEAMSGGGLPAATADYMAMLQAWLERHKEYPRRAQIRRQQGTALLYFVMDREGRVIEYRLQQSAGHTLLDRAVAAMIERAQPLPKIPEDMGQARLELVVPVRFFLR